jgi:saccharopine dehydrogenase (NAD+, L-lysine-forming)
MAMHMSVPHPTDPYNTPGVMLGDAQFAVADQWEARGQLALVGMGVEPGFSDVVARYASDHLFSRIDEIGVRDGSDLVIEGFDFAPTFSIWTTIEECLNPPIVYERERGWFTTAPFSEPETFVFPEGIGPLGCVNVEHEEVLLMPRWIDVGRVTFKYGLGDEFIDVLATLHKLGLDSTRPSTCVVSSLAPRPRRRRAAQPRRAGRPHARAHLRRLAGDVAWARTARRARYLYQVVDNEWTMREYGHQAVVWQTAVNPVVALELLATGRGREAASWVPRPSTRCPTST